MWCFCLTLNSCCVCLGSTLCCVVLLLLFVFLSGYVLIFCMFCIRMFLQFCLRLSQDGIGRGAAIVAAVSHRVMSNK